MIPHIPFLGTRIYSWLEVRTMLKTKEAWQGKGNSRDYLHPLRSHLSFAFPSATVCHSMFEGLSAPPQAKATL